MDWNEIISQYEQSERLIDKRINELKIIQKSDGGDTKELRHRLYLLCVEQGDLISAIYKMQQNMGIL
ncbi:MAG: hypothetical protein RR263_01345 [Oscillospiraceae bacterium]